MNPIRQKLFANGLLKAPAKKQEEVKVVKANVDAIRSRDTNRCKVKKAIALLERSN